MALSDRLIRQVGMNPILPSPYHQNLSSGDRVGDGPQSGVHPQRSTCLRRVGTRRIATSKSTLENKAESRSERMTWNSNVVSSHRQPTASPWPPRQRTLCPLPLLHCAFTEDKAIQARKPKKNYGNTNWHAYRFVVTMENNLMERNSYVVGSALLALALSWAVHRTLQVRKYWGLSLYIHICIYIYIRRLSRDINGRTKEREGKARAT